MIAAVLGEASVGYSDIGRIAVTTGPGSFTGVRIGLATAQGLGLALGVPVIGIDSFTVFAASLETPASCAIVIESRRSEVYWRMMDGEGPGRCEMPSRVALQLPDGDLIIGGDGAGLLPDIKPGWEIRSCLPGPDTTALALLALEVDPALHPPLPIYIRPPDAVPQHGLPS
jgi:tRNA threonylcarbamoyladenosine biosynthesis protein TsaB